MQFSYEIYSCPACGAGLSLTDSKCSYCGATIRKKNNSNAENRNFDYLEEAIQLLKRQIPFLCTRKTIELCIKNLEMAYEENPDAIIDYLRAYVEYDYFERKYLNRKPGYLFFLERAKVAGITDRDIAYLEERLNYRITFGGIISEQ